MNIQKLNNTLLNNQIPKEEIKQEIKSFLRQRKNGNTTHQNLWDTAKELPRGKFIAINAYIENQDPKKQPDSTT